MILELVEHTFNNFSAWLRKRVEQSSTWRPFPDSAALINISIGTLVSKKESETWSTTERVNWFKKKKRKIYLWFPLLSNLLLSWDGTCFFKSRVFFFNLFWTASTPIVSLPLTCKKKSWSNSLKFYKDYYS